jgi:hypothetical protein
VCTEITKDSYFVKNTRDRSRSVVLKIFSHSQMENLGYIISFRVVSEAFLRPYLFFFFNLKSILKIRPNKQLFLPVGFLFSSKQTPQNFLRH